MIECPFCQGRGNGGKFPNDIGYCRCCRGDGYTSPQRIAYFREALPRRRQAR